MDSIVPSDIPLGKHYVYTLSYPESMGGRVFYVGKGTGRRINGHEQEARKGVKSHKCNVIRKIHAHGERVVKKKIAFFNTHDEACMYEIALIFFMDGLTNLASGGGGSVGYVHTEDARMRIRKAREGQTNSAETRRKLSEMHIGQSPSEETRQKISETKRGKPGMPRTEEWKRKISEANRGRLKGRSITEETKRKIGEASKRPANIERLRKMSEANRGHHRKHSEEARRKMSESKKRIAAERRATIAHTSIPIIWHLDPQTQLKCEDINQLSLWSDA